MKKFDKALPIAAYIIKYLTNELTEAENSRLQEWLNEDEENRIFFKRIINKHFIQQELKTFKSFAVEEALSKFLENKKNQQPPVSITNNYKKWWMAAAAVLIVAAGVSYFFAFNKKQGTATAVIVNNNNVINDIKPGGSKAILTLADGSSIELDNATNGFLATQGNAKVTKSDNGKLIYNKDGEGVAKIQYNTITTPRGGQYQLVLADGSQVWLNAASSITYPTSFSGNKREVEITGEAYFEVAHNANSPFHVKVNNMDVEVLGTNFDINAYDDDGVFKTTLLDGSVKVSKGNERVVIKPGEQAQIKNVSDKISIIKDVDVESVVAWKNGKFIFREVGIHEIMKSLERWYNVSVTYQSSITSEKFVGAISRNVNLSQILAMLEKTGVVKFTIIGKTIIVK